MPYLTILDDETFAHKYIDTDTNTAFDTEFTLREVPETVEQSSRRKHTPRKFVRGRDVGELDWAAFSADMLDYAIVAWDRLIGVSRVNGKKTEVDLECSRENKARLPERVKSDILRRCLGREAGLDVGAAADEEGAAPTAPDTKSRSAGVPPLAN